MKTKIVLLALVAVSFFSCKKDKEETVPDVVFHEDYGVLVNNEGNFGQGNSTITYSDGTEEGTYQDIYKKINGENLGDVCQSMIKFNGGIYLAVNNSSKIEVVDARNFKKARTLTEELISPRYVIQTYNLHFFVSDYQANKILVYDPYFFKVNEINLNGFAEEMLLVNNKVYVTNSSTSYVYVIDAISETLEDSVLIGPGGNSIRVDSNNKLWILCGGDFNTNAPGTLHRVDPATKTVELSLTFPAGDYPTKLEINTAGDKLYFVDLNVYQMNISDASLPTTSFIEANGRNFYGLGYDKSTNQIYVSDAIDFQQAGRVYRYNENGNLLGSFPAGIIPGDFLFLNN